MIELPESVTLAAQLRESVTGKTVAAVYPPSSPHKFAWFNGDPAGYADKLVGQRAAGAEGFGIFVELDFGAAKLAFNDGVNVRLNERPAKYQLLVAFTDGQTLAFTVAMYGGIYCHTGDFDNEYYRKSREGVSPLSDSLDIGYFTAALKGERAGLSAKAFLATGQRFPGIGNGTLQDVLFTAGVNPRAKLGGLTDGQLVRLFRAVKEVPRRMADAGGRDTEKDLYGAWGGYKTLMGRKALETGCPRCGGSVVRASYLGGAVYFCPVCQPDR